jgi:hypothetical protein
MSEEIKDETKVKQVSPEELEALIGIDAGVAMLPEEKQKKPSVFSQPGVDTSFLDNLPPADTDDTPPADTPPADDDTPPADTPPADDDTPPADTPPADPNDVLAQPDGDDIDDDPEKKNKGGRPTSMVAAAKSLVEKGILFPFDDGKKIEDYTAADLEEMIEANFQNKEAELQQHLPQQFFQNMPPEMQQAYQYIAQGGQDLKGLFQAMGQSHEIRELDIESEAGQAYAVRSYLQATQYGTPEEIEEEIQSLQDRGDLEKKALQFKPKLDAMQQNMVQQRLQQQEIANKQRQAQSQQYMDNVYQVLAKGDINGIPVDERIQNMIYNGLVAPSYPSVSGKQTNLLGHLLEKYQWVEPNHDLIAEVLWHLADPEGYKSKIKESGEAAATDKVVRKLKTEQSNLHASSTPPVEKDAPAPGKRKLPRKQRNIFSREG